MVYVLLKTEVQVTHKIESMVCTIECNLSKVEVRRQYCEIWPEILQCEEWGLTVPTLQLNRNKRARGGSMSGRDQLEAQKGDWNVLREMERLEMVTSS